VAAAALSISPGTLTFSNQSVGTTSNPQAVTLSNMGTGPVTITSIAITMDFAQTNNCGSSLAGGASCAINVTFTPKATGPRSGTLTITDNASNSPQAVTLSGTGVNAADFSISSSPTSATVPAGQSTSLTLSVTPTGGFSQSVNLSCTGAPTLANCTINPMSLTPNGSSAATATVTITTTAATQIGPRGPQVPLGSPPWANGSSPLLWLLVLALIAACRRRATMRTSEQYDPVWPLGGDGGFAATIRLALLAAGLACLLAACGGGSNVTHLPGTPPGTYTITLTGTDTQVTPNVTHSTTVTLTVSP
jgi:ASPM-SPD-2-Hydin domain-containing protein